MPSFARAILEMRSSLLSVRFRCRRPSSAPSAAGYFVLILWARHYKGCAFGRTLTEIKIQAALSETKTPGRPGASAIRGQSELRFRCFLLRDGEQRSAAEARVHRHRTAFRDFHRAVLELRDLADRVEHRVGEHVRRCLVVAERDEHSANRRAVVG